MINAVNYVSWRRQGDVGAIGRTERFLVMEDSQHKEEIIKPKYELEHIYFATTARKDEVAAIKRSKPRNLLLSYAMWRKGAQRKFDSIEAFVQTIGYKPENIILDSGAFTFHNRSVYTVTDEDGNKREVKVRTSEVERAIDNLIEIYGDEQYGDVSQAEQIARNIKHDLYQLDAYFDDELQAEPRDMSLVHDYMNFIDENSKYITYTINMDVIHNGEDSQFMYEVLKHLGLKPMPVYGYGVPEDVLKGYIQDGNDYIALGGLASKQPDGKRKDGKLDNEQRASFVNRIIEKYPEIKFHLFGTLDIKLIKKVPNIFSVDGGAWIQTAGFKRDRKVGQSKIDKAAEGIRKKEQYLEEQKSKRKDAIFDAS